MTDTDRKLAEEFLSNNGYGSGTNFTYKTVAYLMDEYFTERLKSLAPTEKEIENYAIEQNSYKRPALPEIAWARGARWMLEKLTGKSEEKQKANFMQIVSLTPEEEFAMYMKLPKEEIVIMLLENQRLLRAFKGEPAYTNEMTITSTSYDE